MNWRTRWRALRSLGAGLLAASSAIVACGGPPPSGETVGTSAEAISGVTVLSRADEWVVAELQYCQSPNGADDSIDPACSPVCTRQSNAAWDPYRSDCSGFVSWAWGLPAPGRTTGEFAPADTTVSFAIPGSDLEPGDALNIPDDHIVLFVGWQTPLRVANFYEEPGCSADPPYAHAFTSDVTVSGSNVTIAYEGKTFTAIRFTGISASDAGASPESGTESETGPSAPTCYSDTLGSNVPDNTCVQSSSDDQWYQCDDGSWVDRATDPTACSAVYPLGSSLDGGADGAPSRLDGGADAGAEAGVAAGSDGGEKLDASVLDAAAAADGATPPSSFGRGGSGGCSVSAFGFGREGRDRGSDRPVVFVALAVVVLLSKRLSRPPSRGRRGRNHRTVGIETAL